MPKLEASLRETLVVATVEVVMEVRRMALMNGASPLKLWDQLSSRLRSAARTTESPAEWATKFMRDLQIAAPSKGLSSAINTLVVTIEENARAWLDLLDREHGFIIARARLLAEWRRDQRETDNDTKGEVT